MHRANAVCHSQLSEVPSLDSAGVTVALGHTCYVDLLANGEGFDRYDITYVVAGAIFKAELLEMSLGGKSVLCEMSDLSLGCVLVFAILKAELYGIVAVLFSGLLLRYYAGTSLDYRYRNDVSDLVENLSHTDLLTDNALFHVLSS